MGGEARLRALRLRLVKALLVLAAVVVGGTAGYMAVEGWSFRDALFMTVTTITTVGYGEIQPLSHRGQIYTIALIVAGVGAALYTLNTVVTITMEGELTGVLSERRMRQRIARMREHVIVCGYGRVGEEVARALAGRGEPFLVVEMNREALARAEAAGCDHVHGDATRDETLKEAGIERARCLIAALNSDADNSWVALTARALNAKLWIVARADQPESEAKLRHAGADRVIAPAVLAGGHMALAAVQPLAQDFTNTIVRTDGADLLLAQLSVDERSRLAGLLLGDALGEEASVTVLGLRRADGELVVKPDPALTLRRGDELIVLGRMDDLDRLNARTGTEGRPPAPTRS